MGLLLLLSKCLLLLLLIYMPGCVIESLFARFKPSQRDGAWESEDRLFLRILIGFTFLTLVSLLLILIGWFSLKAISLIVFLSYLGHLLLNRYCPPKNDCSDFQAKYSWRSLGLVFLLAAACILWSGPSEYIFGGWDPGVYVNNGVLLARTGSMDWHHEVFKLLPSDEKPVFYHVRDGFKQLYAGFIVSDPIAGKFVPYFMPSYPLWIGIFYLHFGMEGFLYSTTFISIMSLWAIYAIGKMLMGRSGGLCVGVLALCNVGITWFSKFPNSESLSRLFLLGCVYSLMRWARTQSFVVSLYSILGMLCLGLALSVKFTPFVLIPAVVLYFLVGASHISFSRRFLSLSAVCGIAIVSLSLFHGGAVPQHTSKNLKSIFRIFNRLMIWAQAHYFEMIGLGVLMVGLSLAWFFLKARKKIKLETLVSAVALWIVSLVSLLQVVGWIKPGFFLHPKTPSIELGWYFSWPGLVMCFMGAWLMAFRGKENTRSLLILLFSTSFMMNAIAPWVEPFHFWGGRRLTEIILPLGLVFISFGIWEVWKVKRWGSIMSAIVCLVILIPMLKATKPILFKNDYAGSRDFVAKVNQVIPKDGMIVAGEGWSMLATPLFMIYGIEALQFSKTEGLDGDNFLNALAPHLKNGKKIYYLTDTRPGFTNKVEFEAMNHLRFESRVFDQTKGMLPRGSHAWSPELYIYRIRAYEPRPFRTMDQIHIEIGRSPFGWRGFSPYRKYSSKVSGVIHEYRYLQNEAWVQIPWSAVFQPKMLRLFVGMRDLNETAEMEIYFDEELVGTLHIEGDFKEYAIQLPETVYRSADIRQMRFMNSAGREKISKEEKNKKIIKLDWVQVL